MPRATFVAGLVASLTTAPSFAADWSQRLPNWSRAETVPAGQVTNVVRLESGRLLWNGMATSDANLRQFLGIVGKQMEPQPLTILSFDAKAPAARVQAVRLLMIDTLGCQPKLCMEVTASSDREKGGP